MADSTLQGLPLPDFLNVDNKLIPQERKRKMEKHHDAYSAFCHWASLPEELRNPLTQTEFEKLWRLPKNYTSQWKEREDFQAKRLKYFWNWIFDKFPDVMYAIYRRATRHSAADAKIFAEIVSKKLELESPKTKMLPFVIMGVPQEKIDALFTPKNYQDLADKTVETFKAQEGEVVEEKPVLEVEQA